MASRPTAPHRATAAIRIFAECFAVLCFFCTVTCIFKKNYISIIHCFYSSLCVWSYYFRISSKLNFLT